MTPAAMSSPPIQYHATLGRILVDTAGVAVVTGAGGGGGAIG